MATNLVQIDNDQEIKQRLEAERSRLRKIAGLDQPTHFHRPVERAFTAEERDRVTILFGGFTWKHEDLIRAVFQGCGYRCEKLPVPNVAAFQTGKEFGNNGQCNPTYFTVGNLVQYLQFLEKQGLSRQHILDNYVFFTAGSCGPCRFGMYEAEYRFALKNAGFDGFRVLLFKDSDGIKAESGEPGLKFTVDFGFGMLNAMHLGDVINDLVYQIRPFEVNKGETDRVFRMPGVRLAEIHGQRERRVYNYLFTWRSPAMRGALGSCHALELGFVFGTNHLMRRFAGEGLAAEKLAGEMQDAWLAFARDGDPSCASLAWPGYTEARRATMLFGETSSVADGPFEEERRSWDNVPSGVLGAL